MRLTAPHGAGRQPIIVIDTAVTRKIEFTRNHTPLGKERKPLILLAMRSWPITPECAGRRGSGCRHPLRSRYSMVGFVRGDCRTTMNNVDKFVILLLLLRILILTRMERANPAHPISYRARYRMTGCT
jgi:hypothetical protein